MKTKLALLIASVGAFVVFYLFYSYSYIEIRVLNNEPGSIEYSLTNSRQRETNSFNSSSKVVKRLVKRGNYDLVVNQNNSGHFRSVQTSGLLKTSIVEVELSQPREIEFVGDNPSFCMLYSNKLFSYDCYGGLAGLKIHSEATDNKPTLIKGISSSNPWTVEGVVNTKSDVIGVFRLPESNQDGVEDAHMAFSIKDSPTRLVSGIGLKDLRSTSTYKVLPFRGGFVAIDTNANEIFYYPKINSKPEKIALNQPPNKELRPYTFKTSGNKIIIGYSENTLAEDYHSQQVVDNKSEVFVYEGETAKTFSFSKTFQSIEPCGTQKICALADSTLDVFDISHDTANYLYSVGDVSAISYTSSRLIVVRGDNIIGFDADSRSGNLDVKTSQYSYCGIATGVDYYLLCLIDKRGGRSAIRVNQKTPDSQDLLPKVSKLLDASDVKHISIYKNNVFISPAAGPLKYIRSQGGYGHDPEIIKRSKEYINKLIDSIGIDRSNFKIKFTL